MMKDYNVELEILKRKVKDILDKYIGKRNIKDTHNELNSQLSKLLCDFNNNRI